MVRFTKTMSIDEWNRVYPDQKIQFKSWKETHQNEPTPARPDLPEDPTDEQMQTFSDWVEANYKSKPDDKQWQVKETLRIINDCEQQLVGCLCAINRIKNKCIGDQL